MDEGFTELLADWYYYLMYDRCNEDKIGRLWFGFQKEGIPEKEAAPVPFERNAYSVLEWGGLFIR